MIITISGKPGSGKTTIAKILAKKLKMRSYYIGGLLRKMARDRRMTLGEFYKLGEKEDWIDKKVDNYQKKLGKEKDNFIIQGRTSFHFIPHSVKIFLDVSLDEAAKRIFKDPHKKARNERPYKSVNDVKKEIKERIKSEKKRYKKYYNLDVYNKKHYDFWLDTTRLNIKQVVDKVIKFIKSKTL